MARAGTGNGDLRGAERKRLCLGPGMGLGGRGWLQSGGRTGNKADQANLRWQRGGLMVQSYRRTLWLGAEAGTWLTRGSYGLWWE